MNAIAINSSPKMENGNTAPLLNAFLDGIKEAGANVELFYAKKMNIVPCTGEFKCWGSSPGKCYIKDDMQMLLEKIADSEVLVLGIPVYVPMPGEMQNIINRLMPLLDAKIVVRGRNMYPHARDDLKLKKVVLVSTASFWQMENFDVLAAEIERISMILNAEFHAILRPQADLFKEMVSKNTADKILSSAGDAGRQLISEGRISDKTLKKISDPIMSRKEFMSNFEVANP